MAREKVGEGVASTRRPRPESVVMHDVAAAWATISRYESICSGSAHRERPIHLCDGPDPSSSRGLYSSERGHCAPTRCDDRSRVLSILHAIPRRRLANREAHPSLLASPDERPVAVVIRDVFYYPRSLTAHLLPLHLQLTIQPLHLADCVIATRYRRVQWNVIAY
jgi:hypothetical protein